MVDYVGQQLGNYRLSRLLGQGGSAAVYLGEHIYLNTPAAIKVLQVQLSENALENFLSEARTIARLTHPHIIPVLEFGIQDTTPFLVMSYAPFGSLRQRHPTGTRLPAATIVSYVKQVALALQYAHEHQVIHRDVKPENMLLAQDERVLLSDFGIAVSAQLDASATTQLAQAQPGVAGTCTYMAPEQLHGRPTFASDQYALGVVVYEWFCGSTPFQGSLVEVALQHLQSPPLLLSEKLPGIAPAIEQVVMRTLSKDPEARFASIQHFARALEEACSVALVQASLPTLSAFPPLPTPPAGSPPLRSRKTSSATPLLKQSRPTIPLHPGVQLADPRMLSNTPGQPTLSRRALLLGGAGLAAVGLSVLGAESLWHNLTQSANTTPSTGTHTPPRQPTPTLSPTPDLNATPRAIINLANTRPAVTSSGPGLMDLFVRGSDNALWHRSYTGTWQNWETLGGNLSYDPVVASWGPGRFDVFVRATDNSVQHKWYDGGVWHDWEPLGGLITADPAAVSWGPGRVDVFVRGSFNDLWINTFDGTWHGWQPLGNTFASSPAVASLGAGHLDVFARGIFNDLIHIGYDGTWHAWESLKGSFQSDPTVASWGLGRLDVFVRGTDNALKHRWYAGAWSDWESLGGTVIASPVATGWNGDHFEIFARASDNTLQRTWFDGSWHPWQLFQ